MVLFIFTQMHGLSLSMRKRWVLGLTLTLITIVFYVVRQDLVGFLRNFRLPLSYYLGGLILSLLFAAGVRSFLWTRGLFEREAPRGGVMPLPGESQRPTPP